MGTPKPVAKHGALRDSGPSSDGAAVDDGAPPYTADDAQPLPSEGGRGENSSKESPAAKMCGSRTAAGPRGSYFFVSAGLACSIEAAAGGARDTSGPAIRIRSTNSTR